MLKSMGERTPPCGTPDLNCRFVDVCHRGEDFQYVVDCLACFCCC